MKREKRFKYLCKIITENDDDLLTVEPQLKKVRATWGKIGKIWKKKTSSNPKVRSTFCKVIVQSILLYGFGDLGQEQVYQG